MGRFTWSLKKWLFGLVVLIIMILVLGFVDRCIRCTADGLNRQEALKLANWKINQQFIKNQPNIKIVSEQFENKVWSFEYQDNNCITYMIVDQCGVIDNGGVTNECKMNWSYDHQ